MANKTFIMDFKLPQLSASHYWHSVTIDSTNDIGIALRRGWQEVKKRPAVKGKRIKEATVVFRIVDKDNNE